MFRIRPSLSRALLIAAGAAPVFAISPAGADDGWKLSGELTQRFTGDTNPLNVTTDEQSVLSSQSSLGLTLSSETGSSYFTLSPTFGGIVYVGDGSDQNSNRFTPSVSTAFGHRTSAIDLSGGVDASVTPASYSDIGEISDDTGAIDLDLVGRDALRISGSGYLTADYRINSRDSISFGPTLSKVNYTHDADTLVDSISYGFNTRFRHTLNERIGLSARAAYRRTDFESSPTSSDSNIYTVAGGLYGQITSRFSIDGDAGVSYVDRDGSGGDFAFNTNASFNYRPTSDLNFRLLLLQGIEPGSDGTLQTRSVVNLYTGYQVNTRESAGMTLGYSRQDDTDSGTGRGSSDYFRGSADYTVAILPGTSARLGYGARWRPESGSDAVSHAVTLTLTHSFDVAE